MFQNIGSAVRPSGLLVVALAATFALVAGTDALAAPILDCRTGCNALYGDAIFATGTVQTSGTGNFNPFLRVQNTGTGVVEDGHNTDGTLLNDEKSGTHTHSVPVSTLTNFVTRGGLGYYEFILDIGEPESTSLLSLDQLKVCFASAGDLSKANDCPTTSTYSLDAGDDRSVSLDYSLFGNGNGASDLFFYIPATAFAAALALNSTVPQFFYLYISLGERTEFYGAQGSFEEVAFRNTRSAVVPEPASLLLLGTGLAALGARMRRRTNA